MNAPAFNIPDIIALAVLAIGTFIGYRRRLSGEVGRLIGITAAFIVGLFIYAPIVGWLVGYTRLDYGASRIAGYLFTIIAAVAVMVVARVTLGNLIKVVIAEETDRILGLVAGFVRSAVFVLIIFLAMNLVPHDYLNAKFGQESFIGRIVIRLMPALDDVMQEAEDRIINV